MNRIYRLIWNRTLNAYVVGSELTAAHGKRSGANCLLPPWSVAMVGAGGLLALGLAGAAHATDARLDDLQSLVAKYSQTDAHSIVASALPVGGVQARVNATVAVQLPAPVAVQVKVPVQARLQVAPTRIGAGLSVGARATHGHAAPSVSATTAALATVASAAGAIKAGVGGTALLQVSAPTSGAPGHGGLLGLGNVLLPGKEEGGNPVRAVTGATVSAVEELTGGLLQGAGIGALVDGVVNGATPVANSTGHTAAGVLAGVTGSGALGAGVDHTVGALTSGLENTSGALAQGHVVGTVNHALATVDGTIAAALHGTGSALGGITGSASGVAGLTGAAGHVTHGVIGGVSHVVSSLGNGASGGGSAGPDGLTGVIGGLTGGLTGGGAGEGAGLGGLTGVIGGLTGGLGGGAGHGLIAAVGTPVDGVVDGVAPVLNGAGGALGHVVGGVTGSAGLGAGVTATVGTLTGGLQNTTGALAQGNVQATLQHLAGTVQGTVSTLLGAVGDASGSGGGGGLGGLTGVIGGLTGGLGGGAGHGLIAAVGTPVDGVVDGVAPVLNGAGGALGHAVGGVTGSAGLGAGVTATVGTLTGGLQNTTGALAQGNVQGTVQHLAGTVQGTVSTLVGAVGDAGGSGGGLGGLTGVIGGLTGGLTGGGAGEGAGLGGLTGVIGGLTGNLGGSAGHGLIAAVGTPVDGVVDGVAPVLNGAGGALGHVVGGVTGSAGLGTGVSATVGTLTGGLQNTTGALAQGDMQETVQHLVGTVGGTVSTLLGAVGGAAGGNGNGGAGAGLGGLGNVVGGLTGAVTGLLGQLGGGSGGTTPTSPGQAVTDGIGGVVDLTGGLVAQTGVGGVVDGVVDGAAPVVNGAGAAVGGLVGGLTGSTSLGNGVSGTVGALTGGLQNMTGALAQGNLTGTVQSALGAVNTTAGTLLGAVGSTLGGITGSASGVNGLTNLLTGVTGGVTGGLSNVVGQLTGNPAPTSNAPPPAGPSGLVVGNGGLVGTVGQLIGPTATSLFGGSGYTQNGSLTINNVNFAQAYSTVEVAGLPVVNLSPVGELLDGAGSAITGGNSHLTLIGGVTSDSYITNINNGAAGGLLGLLLPDSAPDWASDCLNLVGIIKDKCWAVPAAQDYQVLIGDGAYANGSKEVVIGTNARHELAQQSASQVFVDANGVMTGVPTADYDARQGQSVVIGDSALGTANAQTLLGAGATSNKANSVAMGYKSNADRGGLDNYSAFGLTAAQTSIGEVAVGSAGRERQITHVAAGSQATDAVNLAQLQGALSLINTIEQNAVLYDTDANDVADYGHVTLGGGNAPNGTVVSNLAAGQLSATSTEAVNGAQLFGIGQSMASYLGGGSTFSVAGVLSAPSYVLNEIGANWQLTSATFGNIGAAFSSISQSLANLATGTNPNPGSNPLAVEYTPDGAGNPTNVVALKGDGSGAAVAVRNVAEGSVVAGSRDAINGGQLATTNEALASAIGGTLQYNSTTGQWSSASFTVNSINASGGTNQQVLDNVTDALAVMDGSIVNVNKRIDNIQNGGAGNAYFSVNSTKAAASATGQDAVAAGPQATASGTQAVAIGNGANASAANSVALGAGSVADRANTVSVGATGAERQVTHVADGSQATDAVNLRQLQASQEGTVRYDKNTDGSTNYASVTMGKAGTSTVIHNVATGVAPTDAVNVAQLNKGMGDVMDWSRNYTDQRFNSISRDIKRVDDRASAGIASAMAMAGLPQPSEAGKRMASFAASTFHGESSMAVGVSGVSDGGRWIYKLSGSANTRGDGGVTVGAGFQW